MTTEEYMQRITHIHDELLQLKKEMQADNDSLKEEYARVANETIDLHHLIELFPTQAHESARIVSRFRDIRLRRREAKDKMLFFDEVLPALVSTTNAAEQLLVNLSLYRRDLKPQAYSFRTAEGKAFADSFRNIEERMSGYTDRVHTFPVHYDRDHEDRILARKQVAVASDSSGPYLILHRDVQKKVWVSVYCFGQDVYVVADSKLKGVFTNPYMENITHIRFLNSSIERTVFNYCETVKSGATETFLHRNIQMMFASFQNHPYVKESVYLDLIK